MPFARGKYAKAISDRSGMEFPYSEMVREWNGMLVHKSELKLNIHNWKQDLMQVMVMV